MNTMTKSLQQWQSTEEDKYLTYWRIKVLRDKDKDNDKDEIEKIRNIKMNFRDTHISKL
jgi:6-phosphogluconate dehydrogenase